jgi:hypothetical protein
MWKSCGTSVRYSDETVEKGFITLQQVENEVISNFHDVPAPTWLSRLVFSLTLKV